MIKWSDSLDAFVRHTEVSLCEKETHSLIIIIVILFELNAYFGIIYPNSPVLENVSLVVGVDRSLCHDAKSAPDARQLFC